MIFKNFGSKIRQIAAKTLGMNKKAICPFRDVADSTIVAPISIRNANGKAEVDQHQIVIVLQNEIVERKIVMAYSFLL